MELKVWVEGIQRIVCGVTEVTTCQDVVFALAHATGKTGRFTLIERWRNNERLLAPHENPLKILMKWGEYSSDVQFILQRSEQKKDQSQQNANTNNNNTQQSQIPTPNPTIPQQQQPHNTSVPHPQSQQQILRHQQKLNHVNNNNINSSNNNTNNSSSPDEARRKLVQNNLKNSTGGNEPYGKQQQQQQHHPQTELITSSLPLERGKESRKSLNSGSPPNLRKAGSNKSNNNTIGTSNVRVETIGLVKGISQKSPNNSTSSSGSSSSISGSLSSNSISNQIANNVEATYASVIKKPKNLQQNGSNAIVGEFNAADLRNSLDRKLNGLLYSNGVNTGYHVQQQQQHNYGGTTAIVGATLKENSRFSGPVHHIGSNDSLLLDSSSVSSVSSNSNHNLLINPINNASSNNSSPITGISSNGALVPPPYRDPPPPRNSPLSHKLDNLNNNNPNASISSNGSGNSQTLNNLNINRKLEKDSINMNLALAAAAGHSSGGSIGSGSSASNANELLLLSEMNLNDGPHQNNTTQYRDLIQLIKYQREKINTQQADLSKYDSEIQYLEGKGREQQEQLETITQEINKTDQVFRQGSEQLQTLQYVEEEGELVRQQEKTLKSEITLLRSKLANCETELLQCKNKIRLLMDEIQVEQRKYCRQYDSNRAQLERHLMSEVDRIQLEIDLAIQSADHTNKTTEKLKGEVASIESNIAEKKKQVEKLVHEMKEANLQSLAVAPADEVRHLLEGTVKPGSTRRMIGSPRQLENAVPTSKNPHGVWV
ncbi:ras association domain-containing protein 8 isoform X2 [Toxorhynchites rutilus septentrionalis]|uniref:ras association domain-containing protein 8 isoform X2 n=1 Tax=Toxorhynchites rutilus septentrionalis TaxID=329112 RepID=UPI00247A6FB3|nr:ras association domain-containing protein 8 isoform X2 [Toxorhynchites rutilus septentrionalis]